MGKKPEEKGILAKVAGAVSGAVGGGEKEPPGLVLDGVSDLIPLAKSVLEGEEKDVLLRISTATFTGGGDDPSGLDPQELEGRSLNFLDELARVEMQGENRPAVLEAITEKGVKILEPETTDAPDPQSGKAPTPRNTREAAPRFEPPPPPNVRDDLTGEDGLIELIVLRDAGIQTSRGELILEGRRGRFTAAEAQMHLIARNARLPEAEDK